MSNASITSKLFYGIEITEEQFGRAEIDSKRPDGVDAIVSGDFITGNPLQFFLTAGECIETGPNGANVVTDLPTADAGTTTDLKIYARAIGVVDPNPEVLLSFDRD